MTREEIINKLKLASASEEFKEEIITTIVDVVERRFASMIEDVMTPEQSADFKKLSPDDPKVAQQWFRDNIPNAGELYAAVMNDYIDELVADMSSIMKRADEKRGGGNH